MVEHSGALDRVFHALASDARRLIVERLSRGDLTVGEVAAPLEMSLAAASKHVGVLEAAGVVRRSVQGRRHVCSLAPGGLREAAEWLTAPGAGGRRAAEASVIARRPALDEEID